MEVEDVKGLMGRETKRKRKTRGGGEELSGRCSREFKCARRGSRWKNVQS